MFENIDWLPGRDSHMLPIRLHPPDKCFVFSSQIFRERSLARDEGPIRERKAGRKGTKSAAYFSHIFVPAARNACSGLAAVIGATCRQVDELSPFWSARFGLRRFLCLLLREVTQEQLRERDLHEASVSDRNHHFFMRLVRGWPSGSNGNNFGVFGHARS